MLKLVLRFYASESCKKMSLFIWHAKLMIQAYPGFNIVEPHMDAVTNIVIPSEMGKN